MLRAERSVLSGPLAPELAHPVDARAEKAVWRGQDKVSG